MSRYETEYIEVKVTVAIMANLHPYLVTEARRRKLTIDALVSQILNENLTSKRINSRKKEARLLGNGRSAVKP